MSIISHGRVTYEYAQRLVPRPCLLTNCRRVPCRTCPLVRDTTPRSLLTDQHIVFVRETREGPCLWDVCRVNRARPGGRDRPVRLVRAVSKRDIRFLHVTHLERTFRR